MTRINFELSQQISKAIKTRGGRYLEVVNQCNTMKNGATTVIVLAAGDKSLFNECKFYFNAMGRSSVYLGKITNVSKILSFLRNHQLRVNIQSHHLS